MANIETDIQDDFFSDFIGENVRVITSTSHYRGKCASIDVDNNNVLLKDVLKKDDMGWIDISSHMLVMARFIESIYIEKSFPFDSNEAVLLAVEEGKIIHGFEQEPGDKEDLNE